LCYKYNENLSYYFRFQCKVFILEPFTLLLCMDTSKKTKYDYYWPKSITTAKLQGYLQGSVGPRPIAFASTVDTDGNPNFSF
jgi:hypothetical protein